MMSVLRLRALVRGVWDSRVRVAMMIVSIGLSIVAVGGLLAARTILNREVALNYSATRPPSATLILPGGIGPEVLAEARRTPNIGSAAARGSLVAQVDGGDGIWRQLVVFIAAAADARDVATNEIESGSWPPVSGGVLLERTALPFLGVDVGDVVTVRGPAGPAAPVTIAGTVHDGSLAPASQERTAYAYGTTSLLYALGEPPTLTELKVAVVANGAPSGDPVQISAVVQGLAERLAAVGYPVTSIQIPPPLRHPHQGQMDTVGFLMVTFAAIALVLSSILVATMLGGMLANQVGQIGSMKTVGATTPQVLVMYLSVTTTIAVTATGLAIWPGLLLGRALAGWASELLNLRLTSVDVPGAVIGLEVVAGVAMPLVIALVPLVRGSRITVRQAIAHHGSTAGLVRPSRLPSLLARRPGVGMALPMALRNLTRRTGRLALTVVMLGVAGAMFLVGVNASTAWTAMVDASVAIRHYDLELRLGEPTSPDRLLRAITDVPGVVTAEGWGAEPTAVVRPGVIDESRIYPDDAHGSFTIVAPPVGSDLFRPTVTSGQWLDADGADGVVLNNLAVAAYAPGIAVGDPITLRVSGGPHRFVVAGLVSDFGSQAIAYLADAQYRKLAGDGVSQVRIVTAAHDPATRQSVLRAVDSALAAAGIGLRLAVPIEELRTALDQHVLVLALALLALSAVLGVVALLGLASSISTSITERTREFGIVKTLGARPATIRALVVFEGVLTAGISAVLAGWLALPATRIFGDYIGNQAFRTPLPYRWSATGLVAWLTAVLVGATVVSAIAATRATRLTITDAFRVS